MNTGLCKKQMLEFWAATAVNGAAQEREREEMTHVYIGCGAGFSGDRFDAAIPVVETLSRCDGARFLIF